MAYYGDKTPKEAFDVQPPRIRRLWGLTTQVGGAELITERCTKFTPPGDSESPVTDFELELKLIQAHTAQKSVLWVEVGARALRVRSVSATPRARSRTLRWNKTLKPSKTTTAQIQITARVFASSWRAGSEQDKTGALVPSVSC